jgi:hypothetical protein
MGTSKNEEAQNTICCEHNDDKRKFPYRSGDWVPSIKISLYMVVITLADSQQRMQVPSCTQ